jgi:hypothetical protein
MSAQTSFADRGPLDNLVAVTRNYPPLYLKSGQTLYGNQIVFVSQTNGFAYGSPDTDRVAIGILRSSEQTATSDTSTQIAPQRGCIPLNNSGTSALTSAHIGKLVYAEDNQTARAASGSGYSPLGTLLGFDSNSKPWIEVGVSFLSSMAGAVQASNLASVSSGYGASLVGVQDPAGYFAGTDVEAVLAELGKNLPIEIADPGTAAAIPVNHSGTIMLTIGAGAETNTLAIPTFVGQRLIITAGAVSGGTRAITAASAINAAGNTVMTFNAARDNIELRAVKVGSSMAWEVGFNASVALS